ncbi:hypothetical protein AK830_g5821 [Neonectria ditissima]|uniref:Zn(2)-C6 fungal-type domain-containing protein n=1 Tax=Neonectria ditissima TaxID=78410 RepID=A0A0P7B2Z1_9HYPO|nr:hypothetical protein AK830_g5821 [Neonectria ditissima]
MSNIVRAEEGIDLCTEMFMNRMAEVADTDQVIDISKWVQMYAFDVIGQLFFSRMFGFMKDRGDYRGYIRSLDLLLPTIATSCVLPAYLRPLFLLVGAMVPRIYKALGSLKEIEEASKSCVAERQQLIDSGDNSEKKDILSSLFEIVHEKGEKADFGTTEVQVEVYVALFAGSDTTAAAISSILYHLMGNPAAYHKLKEEINEATKSGQLSFPNVRYNEAMKLPYLVACCKEGMRMHPSVGFTLPRNVPKGGRKISGEWFVEGVKVGINAAVIHRDKTVFGDDADFFNPDRWLQGDTVDMDRCMFQFGGGSRTCIGKNMVVWTCYIRWKNWTAQMPLNGVAHDIRLSLLRLPHILQSPRSPGASCVVPDVLKRHWTTCKPRIEENLDIPILSQQIRGKKRKACDRCVRLKRACNRQKPCKTCSEKNEACSYNRVAHREASQSPTAALPLHPPGFQEQTLEERPDTIERNLDESSPTAGMGEFLVSDRQLSWDTADLLLLPTEQLFPSVPESTDLDLLDQFYDHSVGLGPLPSDDLAIYEAAFNSGPRFCFLNRFTPSSGLASCFECGTSSERRQILDSLRCSFRIPTTSDADLGSGEHNWATSIPKDKTQHLPLLRHQNLHVFGQSSPRASKAHQSQLFRTNEIVQMLKDVTTSKPKGSKKMADWSPVVEKSCYAFFSPSNLEKFLLLFWACWYPNCPIIHRPTFAAGTASPSLLGSMALIGACLSPDSTDRTRAKVWLNNMEEAVFNQEILLTEHTEFPRLTCDSKNVFERLQAIQAAYLVCLLQNWEGSKESKQRIRRERYTSLIATARDLNLGQFTLDSLNMADAFAFNWNEFILLETLIRVGTYIFLLDSAFVLFHNSPPRMMMPELNIDLICPDACFEANSAQECFVLLLDSTKRREGQPRLKISTALELLCRTEGSDYRKLQHLGVLNMFTIVTALNYLIFHFQSSLADLSQSKPVDVGLSRWISLWYQSECQNELKLRGMQPCQDMWKRVGFMQHAPEYFLLARILLDRWKLQHDGCNRSLAMWAHTQQPVCTTYDESEMNQFRELIRGF